jgi:solute carrier family 8 (sodium/calcium exchanger)
MFEFMNVQAPKLSTFYNHQKFYIHPGIIHIWKNYTDSYVEYVKQQGNPMALGGDGRADSPGHSAKYGVSSVIDLGEGLVVHKELVHIRYF